MIHHCVFPIRRTALIAVLATLVLLPVLVDAQTRIKDIAQIAGVENRRLTGVGLVTGLQGTGDGTQIISTIQAHANYLMNMGIEVDQNRLRQRNMAMVNVYADIPPFSKRGAKVDIVVSTMGDARSLEGGVLLMAPLSDGMSDQTVAIASGPIVIGGSNLRGADAPQNFPTTGRVLNGAQLMMDLEQSFETGDKILLNLIRSDFTTAFRVAEVINEEFGPMTAKPLDPATIEVSLLEEYIDDRQVKFIAQVEQLAVDTDLPAKVIINERTGTVIAGNDVTISAVMISHGGLTVNIRPPAGAPADQAEQQGAVVVLDERTGSSVQDLAAALNALQVTPRDLVAIFQALKAQGALKAELEII